MTPDQEIRAKALELALNEHPVLMPDRLWIRADQYAQYIRGAEQTNEEIWCCGAPAEPGHKCAPKARPRMHSLRCAAMAAWGSDCVCEAGAS